MWKLMLPGYLMLFASIAWAVWTWGGLAQSGVGWWSFFWILPCLIPIWTVGGRRWNDRVDADFRRATPQDASELARVHVESWHEGYRGIVPDAHLQEFTVATLWVLEKNVQARRFYEAMGFAADGVTKEIDLGARLVAVRHSKRLHTVAG